MLENRESDTCKEKFTYIHKIYKQRQIHVCRERERERTWGDGKLSLPLNATRSTGFLLPVPAPDLGRRKRSKMAITRNIEMRMAVATNPNDTALTELSSK